MTDLVHSVRKGEGTPCVLLHSGGMSSRQWRRLQDGLAREYMVVAPDFLGCGGNPPWPREAPFHYDQDVEAVARIMEGLGAPAHVVGHSYGGLVALTLARKYPERVRSVAVYDPVCFGVLHDAQDAEGLADVERPALREVLASPELGGTAAWFEAFVDYWNGEGAWQMLPPEAQSAFLSVGYKVYLEVRSLGLDRTPRAAYAAIAGPGLIIHGENSPPAARRVAALLAEAIPRGAVRALPGAGHMGPITHGPAFGEIIRGHLASS